MPRLDGAVFRDVTRLSGGAAPHCARRRRLEDFDSLIENLPVERRAFFLETRRVAARQSAR